ncbi:MAG: hypothetical protein DDT39_01459 [Firmicutes bacterium]|nr:hypothetical protein [candidate division NPL-UPA2 bacterium]
MRRSLRVRCLVKRLLAAARSFSGNKSANSRMPRAPLGLATTSTAPLSNACSVSLAPSTVRLLTMMMGVGRSAIISLSAAKPLICGLATSMVMTSGLSSRALRTASLPSPAVATTSISPHALMIVTSSRRKKAESSTTSTRSLDKTIIVVAKGLTALSRLESAQHSHRQALWPRRARDWRRKTGLAV